MWQRKHQGEGTFQADEEAGSEWDKDKEVQKIITVGGMEGSSLWLKSGVHGSGESRRSRTDCEMTCVVNVGSYLQLFLVSAEK